MKNPNQTQPISTQTNKLTSKAEEPPPVYYWNDNKDELGFDEDDWSPIYKRNDEEQSEHIKPIP
jgi:hypothetical protein